MVGADALGEPRVAGGAEAVQLSREGPAAGGRRRFRCRAGRPGTGWAESGERAVRRPRERARWSSGPLAGRWEPGGAGSEGESAPAELLVTPLGGSADEASQLLLTCGICEARQCLLIRATSKSGTAGCDGGPSEPLVAVTLDSPFFFPARARVGGRNSLRRNSAVRVREHRPPRGEKHAWVANELEHVGLHFIRRRGAAAGDDGGVQLEKTTAPRPGEGGEHEAHLEQGLIRCAALRHLQTVP